MNTLLLICHADQTRQWEHELAARLRAMDCRLGIEFVRESGRKRPLLDRVLAFERRKLGVSSASLTGSLVGEAIDDADLVIDLTGNTERRTIVPVLTISIAGTTQLEEGLQRLRTMPGAPDIVARLDGKPIALARPMLSDKVWLSRDCNEVLAACQSLIVLCVKRHAAGRLQAIEEPAITRPARPFIIDYGMQLLSGLAGRALRKFKPGARPFYWQTGYRLIDGPGVAETLKLDGTPFKLLTEGGDRFYADPFPFEYQGRLYLFVEDYPYSTGKGVISVALLLPDGTFTQPQPVLEEPHHLSYPNVFEHDGSIFMIPESGSANEVVLYRADVFPNRWVRDTVLLADRCFNDATVLQRDGRFWMFGTERFGRGSASDTLMVYSATDLRGPWQPHPLNPILIDRAGARPGGHFVQSDRMTFLPVQDGTLKYGGGLGLREVIRLDDEDVLLGPVRSVQPGDAWHGTGIHTLTRSGRLEIIDSTP